MTKIFVLNQITSHFPKTGHANEMRNSLQCIAFMHLFMLRNSLPKSVEKPRKLLKVTISKTKEFPTDSRVILSFKASRIQIIIGMIKSCIEINSSELKCLRQVSYPDLQIKSVSNQSIARRHDQNFAN